MFKLFMYLCRAGFNWKESMLAIKYFKRKFYVEYFEFFFNKYLNLFSNEMTQKDERSKTSES